MNDDLQGKKRIKTSIGLIFGLLFIAGCSPTTQSLEVTASAYTSTADETDATPSIAAWGDTLQPGMKAIAVSRDLLEMGLSHGVKVRIAGLKGKYTVLDKMNQRWTRKIDIYMGTDKERAKQWGTRTVVIQWNAAQP